MVFKAGPEKELVSENAISATDILYGVAAVDGAWLARTGRALIKVSAASSGTSRGSAPPATP
jgi:hypothetical protein